MLTINDVTPALNAEILERVNKSFKPNTNVTKKEFNKAFKNEVIKLGLNFKEYDSKMKEIGSGYYEEEETPFYY